MAVKEDEAVIERVGGYELEVVFAEETPETRERWARRSEAIAAWMLAEWKRQNREGRN
jgi:hypothetical protein